MRNRSFSAVLVGMCLAAMSTSAGCGGASDRSAIEGKVKFKNGQTMDRGLIEFSPLDSSAGASGPATRSGARIFEGAYEIPIEKGLRSGKYLVRIYSPSSRLSGTGGPGGVMQLPKERVSAKYNSDSTLQVEVTADQSVQTFDFEVE